MPATLHVALAQLRPRKGDYAANLARLRDVFAALRALDPRPDVLQLPETALTGYFLEGGVRDLAVTAGTLARDLHATYLAAGGDGGDGRTLDVVVGFYELFESTLYNSAMYVTLGPEGPSIRHVHRKNFLPTYGLFDEERFVERGHEIRAFDAPWGKAGILVCEDAWHSISGTIAALDGAEVIFICAAAPARGVWPRDDGVPGPASVARWERVVRDIAEEHGVFVTFVDLVGSEAGKMFGGSSMVAGPKGDVRVRAPMFDEAIVTVSLDLGDLARARADMPLLSDFRTALPHIRTTIDRIMDRVPASHDHDPAEEDGAGAVHGLVRPDAAQSRDGARSAGDGSAALPSTAPAAQGRLRDADVPDGRVGRVAGENARATAVRPEGAGGRAAVATAPAPGPPPQQQDRSAPAAAPYPSNANGFVVVRATPADHGLPAPLDIDAPLVEAWLVTFIRDELRRRGFSKAVVGVSGGVDSAVTSFLAARALGPENVVGVRLPYRSSSRESLEHAQLVIDALGIEGRTIDISAGVDGYLANEPDADPARRGNVMARMRMIALFDLSTKYRALPLGTGNKTERLFGYFTWHADDSPPVNPLGDLFKTQVWALARHLGVPEVIVGKPASADLIQGQTDEGDFGISYGRADTLLNWMLTGYSPSDLIARGFDPQEVELVRKRLEGTHWKRRLPTVAVVSQTAIGESYLRPVDY
jgi:NAD+ synthetase